MKKFLLSIIFLFLTFTLSFAQDQPDLTASIIVQDFGVGGINRYFGDATQIQDNEAWDVMNMEFGRKRKIRARAGRDRYNVNRITSTVTGIYQGTNGLLVGKKNGVIYEDSSGTFSSVGSGYGTTYHYSFATFYDSNDDVTYDLWCNGTTIKQWDGTTVSTCTGSPESRFIRVFKTRLAAAGNSTNPRRLKICAEGDLDDWSTADDYYWIEIPMGSDEITSLYVFFNNVTSEEVLFIFGRDHIFALTGDDPTGTYAYRLHAVSSNVGAVSHFAIAQVGNDLLFWSRDGLRSLYSLEEGFKIEGVTKSSLLGTWVEDLNAARYPYLYGIKHSRKGQFFSLLTTGGATQTNLVPVFDYFNAQINPSGQCWTRFEFNTKPSCAGLYIDSNGKEWLMTGDYFGDVYKHDVGQDDEGVAYEKYVESKHFNDGIPDWWKIFAEARVKVKTYGNYNLNCTKIYDEKRISPSVSLALSSEDTAIWGTRTWGPFVWGASATQVKRINLRRMATAMGLRFSNSNINEQFELSNLVIYRRLGPPRRSY